eukprot:scaffold7377_cov389-Prasinococcus_capsulatus_cf.AAC.18
MAQWIIHAVLLGRCPYESMNWSSLTRSWYVSASLCNSSSNWGFLLSARAATKKRSWTCSSQGGAWMSRAQVSRMACRRACSSRLQQLEVTPINTRRLLASRGAAATLRPKTGKLLTGESDDASTSWAPFVRSSVALAASPGVATAEEHTRCRSKRATMSAAVVGIPIIIMCYH